MSKSSVNQGGSRHIHTRLCFRCDLVREKVLELVKVAGAHKVANALNTPFPSPTLRKPRGRLLGTRRLSQAFVSWTLLVGSGDAAAPAASVSAVWGSASASGGAPRFLSQRFAGPWAT